MSHPRDLGEVHWVIALEDPVDLPASADADELVHHLTASASERFGATGMVAAGSERPFPHHAWRLTGCTSRSQVWLARSGLHLHLYVAGPEALPDELDVWHESLAVAKELLGGSGSDFQWAGILGPDPDARLVGPATFEPFRIDGLVVRPAQRPLAEWRETNDNISSRLSAKTWPLIIEGSSRGHTWDRARRRAALELRRLSALLSIASAHPWLVRQHATPAEPGKLDLPDAAPMPAGWPRPEIGFDIPWKSCPSWLPAAMATLDADDDLCSALLGHHEGVLLTREHPSMAAVAHVAALDGIGKRYTRGSKKRVRAAAEQVLSPQEADDLIETYALRCSTVHQGAMHGDEVVSGVFTMPRFLAPDDASEFIWGPLRQLEMTTRAVIVHLLDNRSNV